MIKIKTSQCIQSFTLSQWFLYFYAYDIWNHKSIWDKTATLAWLKDRSHRMRNVGVWSLVATELSHQVATALLPNARQQMWLFWILADEHFNVCPVSKYVWHAKDSRLLKHVCRTWINIFSPSQVIVTSPYARKLKTQNKLNTILKKTTENIHFTFISVFTK